MGKTVNVEFNFGDFLRIDCKLFKVNTFSILVSSYTITVQLHVYVWSICSFIMPRNCVNHPDSFCYIYTHYELLENILWSQSR